MTSIELLIAEARKLLSTEHTELLPLERLTEEARELFTEKSFRVGTVRRWGGIEYQKQQDRKWSKVVGQFKNRPAQGGIASVPVTHFKKPTAARKSAPPASAPPAPAKAAPAPAPDAKKATADSLPDDPYKYFKKTPDSQLIAVSALKTIRARPEGIANAAKHMANAFNGDGEKRKPISLKDNGDGTYTVADGNSTTAMAKQHNWKNIVAIVEPPGAAGDDHHAEPAPKKGSGETSSYNADTIAKLAGKLPPQKSLAEHVKIAEEFLGKHSASLDKSVADLQSKMPEGTKVKGRVKKLDSALGKLVRKPKYVTADRLQDGTGMRVIAADTATLEKSIAALKKNYKIVEQDDYITKPQGGDEGLGYRSYHAIIEDKDGLQKEIQLRTPNQNAHADWCHDVYKPQTPTQEQGMKTHAEEISRYARDMGDFFAKVDANDKPGEAPPCPPPVKQFFTCL